MTNKQVLDMYVPGWRKLAPHTLALRLVAVIRQLNPSLGEHPPTT